MKSRPIKLVNPYSFSAFCDEVDLKGKPVYLQFYEWLEREHGFADANTMHSRCRVGPLVMKALHDLEKKRLCKVHKLTAAKAKSGLFWSDLGCGPLALDPMGIYVDEDTSHRPEWPVDVKTGAWATSDKKSA